MARIKHFYVHTLPDGSAAHGEAEVTWSDTTGGYEVEARTAHNVTKGSVYFNEAGFAHRQWEVHCEGIGDNLFPTLRSAVQAILQWSAGMTKTREMARELGLVPA